jgi:hypothetical protein
MTSLVRTLEAWLGLGGGALGVVSVFALSLAGPRALDLSSAYAAAVPYDTPGVFTVQVFTALSALPIIAATICFAGATAGVWLDLIGRRQLGKLILIVCLGGLLVAYWTAVSISLTLTICIVVFFQPVLAATILASVRKEPQSSV